MPRELHNIQQTAMKVDLMQMMQDLAMMESGSSIVNMTFDKLFSPDGVHMIHSTTTCYYVRGGQLCTDNIGINFNSLRFNYYPAYMFPLVGMTAPTSTTYAPSTTPTSTTYAPSTIPTSTNYAPYTIPTS